MSQLFHLTRPDFMLPVLTDEKRHVSTIPAEKIPTIMWPDGRWCFPANLYMLSLFKRGLSRKGRGGTLAAYAASLSPLLRYCFSRGVELHELSDGQFSDFVGGLREERRATDNVRLRDDNSVLAIGRTCLGFLSYVAEFREDPTLLGPKGRIRAYKVAIRRPKHTRFDKEADTDSVRWHHDSFPTADPKLRRLPISADTIKRLRTAIFPCSASIYQRKRRYAMLRVLEITGGRRMEVAALQVESVYAALKSPKNELKLLTVKRKGDKEHFRYVPVGRADLVSLMEFIEVNRQSVIRRTCGRAKDHGYVFVNERTGMPLNANTVTQEIHLLAKHAGIKEVTCPHMFRHRFITKIFLSLIERYDFENGDDFRKALLETNELKIRLQQWTGHSRLQSLDRYIDLAFGELNEVSKPVEKLRDSIEVDAIRMGLERLAENLEEGDLSDGASRLRVLTAALDQLLRHQTTKK
ncbi:tyrosine-type recombinase/integrase [Variovorax paradoxus]|jgi:site-specific recombinase XerD|nr:tyrosine-type recombinase/integrase [Variovorax paradoxus]